MKDVNKKNVSTKEYTTRSMVAVCSVLITMAILIAVVVVPKLSHFIRPEKEADTSVSTKKVSETNSSTQKPETTAKQTTESPTERTTTTTTLPPTTTKPTAAPSKPAGCVDSAGKVTFSVSDSYRADYDYCVAVNRIQNVVTVYGKDQNGSFSVPIKAMLSSCGIKSPDGGIPTPTGTYTTLRKDRWLLLVGNCWGQYTTKVVGSIFFHSVPYYTKDASNLQYNEFPKLGNAASHGCIRLSVADSKWIHDNLKLGTAIYIYDSNNPGPLGKPSPVPFDINSPNRGWDPTDDDVNNPWNKQ